MIFAVVAVLAVVVVVVAAGVVLAARNRRPPDDIASFRRQIDALSPEARRQTSDRMNPTEQRPTGDDGADET
jgi:hypothetical protein